MNPTDTHLNTVIRPWGVSLLAAVMLVASVCPTALAKKKKGPRTLEDVQNERTQIDKSLIGDFRDQYEQDEEPTLLVLIGMDRRAGRLGGSAGFHQNTTPGSVVTQTGVGGNLSLFDSSGITEQIGSELKGWLLKNRALDLVDPESLSDLDRRDAVSTLR